MLVKAIGKALEDAKPKEIDNVQNCTPKQHTLVNEYAVEIPKGEYLYGIRLKNGEYKHVIASDIVNAACRLKVPLSDIKRAMPIKYGG
jgi:NADH:ubiquinone oxidoreductase subunit D